MSGVAWYAMKIWGMDNELQLEVRLLGRTNIKVSGKEKRKLDKEHHDL